MRDEVADGWKISQVESLVGLPRRDIQRACYEGAGGLGIVKPRNTTWGWRVYEVPDVAKLFLMAQGRRQGKALDELRDELASCEGARDMLCKLARCEQAACEARDAHAGASMSARALRCAIEQGDVTVFAGLIDASFAEEARAFCDAHAALGLAAEGLLSKLFADLARVRACGQAASSNEAKEICAASAREVSERCALRAADAGMLLAQAMSAPGVGLACELWLGPATWTYANAAFEASQLDVRRAGASEEERRAKPLGDAKEQSAV